MNKIGPLSYLSSSKSQSLKWLKIVHHNQESSKKEKTPFWFISRKSKLLAFQQKKKKPFSLFSFLWKKKLVGVRCCTCSLQWRFLQFLWLCIYLPWEAWIFLWKLWKIFVGNQVFIQEGCTQGYDMLGLGSWIVCFVLLQGRLFKIHPSKFQPFFAL